MDRSCWDGTSIGSLYWDSKVSKGADGCTQRTQINVHTSALIIRDLCVCAEVIHCYVPRRTNLLHV